MSARAPTLAYAVLSLAFGLVEIAVLPPFQAPDESEHFLRAQQIAEGVVLPERRPDPARPADAQVNVTGGELPVSLAAADRFFAPLRLRPDRAITTDTLRSAFELRLAPGRRAFLPFANTALASPLPYLPQAFGVGVARATSDSVVAQAYAGRLANLLFATALTATAVALTPIAPWGFAVLALAPTMLAQSASLSSDASTNALAFLWIAAVLRAAAPAQRRLGTRARVALVALAMALGLVKQMYLPLPLLAFAIPAERFGGRARRIAFVALLLAAAAIATAAWSVPANAIFSPIERGIDPGAQLAHVLRHPALFAAAVARTLAASGSDLFWQYWGVLGTLDTEIPHALLAAFAAVALVVAALAPEAPTPAQRLVALAVAAATFASVCLSIHMIAAPVGHDVVWLQGRYLVPIGPLLLLPIAGLLRGTAAPLARALPMAVVIFLIGAEIATARSVVLRYFRRGTPAVFEWIARDQAFRAAAQPEAIVATFAAALAPPSEAQVALHARAVQAELDGRPAVAIAAYREILAADPGAPLVARPLATLLLARTDPTPAELAEAERLARGACRESRSEDPADLALLVTALIAEGRSSEAIAPARRAIELARAVGDEALAMRLERALALAPPR